MDYITDILLVYKKYEGRKMTVQVRRHAYVRHTFIELMCRENDLTSSIYVPYAADSMRATTETMSAVNLSSLNEAAATNGLLQQFLPSFLRVEVNRSRYERPRHQTIEMAKFGRYEKIKLPSILIEVI